MLEKLLAKRHIARLDLDSVRLKVESDLGWTTEKTTQVELEYRRFLYALVKKPQEFSISPPTTDVDEFWHRHILDTRKYREACDLIFGRYMDHTPGLNSDQQARADARRRQVYAEYGIDSIYFGSRDEKPHADGGDGGGDGGGDSGEHSHSSHHGDSHGGDHDGTSADGGGHGGGDSGGDGGGGDGGGGDGGGGCGGGSCGGGCGG